MYLKGGGLRVLRRKKKIRWVFFKKKDMVLTRRSRLVLHWWVWWSGQLGKVHFYSSFHTGFSHSCWLLGNVGSLAQFEGLQNRRARQLLWKGCSGSILKMSLPMSFFTILKTKIVFQSVLFSGEFYGGWIQSVAGVSSDLPGICGLPPIHKQFTNPWVDSA